MKFLVCIFLSAFCVFAQANEFILSDKSSLQSSLKEMDSPQVLSQLLQAAEQGDSYAQARLGMFYFRKHIHLKNNTKVSDELEQALRWFTESANRGNADAQVMLGMAYCCGEPQGFRAKKGFFFKKPLVEEDWVEALHWLKKAVDQGHPQLQPNADKIREVVKLLSILEEGTEEGLETEEDWAEALEILERLFKQ